MKKNLPFKRNSSVAVIGSGIAGIHMSWSLKKLGLENIDIYEKNTKAGGKTQGFEYNDITYNVGAFIMGPKLSPLAEELKLEYQSFKPYRDVLIQYDEDGVGYAQQSMKYLTKLYNKLYEDTLNETEYQAKYIATLQQFNERYCDFEDDNRLPRREHKNEIAKPMKLFLEENNMNILVPPLHARLSHFGYGSYNTPMFYMIKLHCDHNGGYVIENGMIQLVNKMIQDADLNPLLNTEVLKVSLPEDHSKKVLVESKNGNIKEYDFVIIAVPGTTNILDTNNSALENIFKDQDNYYPAKVYYHTQLLTQKLYAYQDYTAYNTDCPIGLQADMSHLNAVFGSSKYLSSENKSLVVSYQYFLEHSSLDINKIPHDQLIDCLKDDTKKLLDAEIIDIVQDISWPDYTPHFSSAGIAEGFPWQLWEYNQDPKNSAWFIGGGSVFELVEEVVLYNIDLLESYKGFDESMVTNLFETLLQQDEL